MCNKKANSISYGKAYETKNGFIFVLTTFSQRRDVSGYVEAIKDIARINLSFTTILWIFYLSRVI